MRISMACAAVSAFAFAAALLGAPGAGAAAASGTAAASSAPVPDLGFGQSGSAVQALQQDLLDLGFTVTGQAGGTFGATTWEAVVFFQRDSALYPGGDMTPATWAALRAALGGQAIGAVPLAEWDTGAAVATLQGDLHQLGYSPGTADGTFGPATLAALEAFQSAQGLPPAGTLDAATFSALMKAMVISGYTPDAPPVPAFAAGLVPAAAPASSGAAGGAGAAGGGSGTAGAAEAAAAPGTGSSAAAGSGSGTGSSAAGGASGTAGAAAAGSASGTGSSTAAGSASGPQILAYWAVWGSNATALSSLQANGTAIRWLSPYWYTLESSGTLQSRETDHAQVLAAAAASGERVLALINDGSGVSGLLSTAAGRSTAVQSVVALLSATPGLDGVMIDFESMPSSAGSELTAFVAALRAGLPAADTVGVAVGPEVEANEPGEGLYDYAALGQAADLVQVMTYDDHDGGSAPGPISPTSWVQSVADYAASVIPPSKILLGVPAYGYDWSAPGDGTTVTVPQAQALAAEHGVTPQLNAADGEDYFQYTDGSGDVHTVWYEAPAGVAAKRQIAAQMGLGGLALWTIGGESAAFWPALEGD